MTRARKPLTRWEVIRDATSLVLGWVLVFQQALYVPPGDVNEAFLALAFNLILGPGVLQAYASRGSRVGIDVPSLPQAPSLSRRRQSSSLYDTEADNEDV